MKTFIPLILALAPFASAIAAPAAVCSVAVKQEPVVIRMSKDEFRIAFGVTSDECRERGCSGIIWYKAQWRTEDGADHTDNKALSYEIPKGASESIAVDRHYFDTSEGKHTTELVGVNVGDVSCLQPRLTVGR